ncbi:MAG: glycogen debranching protein GlgX [Candidatus Riflebacteria bacterium]|nr:glycogen debranching protein GlgX [Candidatus Riflebacteria bacterium]
MTIRPRVRSTTRLSEGRCHPLGATLQPDGVNFAIYSKYGRRVFLLLFDGLTGEPTDVIPMEHRSRHIWHTFVHGPRAGQLYGYKIDGPHDPRNGFRFNPDKLLIDPYAKAITGKVENVDNLLLGYDPDSPDLDLSLDSRDSAPIVPRSIVVDDAFDWQGDVPPETPLERTIIYEVHVKGYTAHRSSGVNHPGTYLGFVEKIPHLVDLGITAVELLPVHEFCVEDFLVKKGLTNYWGYNTIGFFAPELSYSTRSYPGCQVHEFKTLVRELHRAGIEAILDVVYNHTGEGSELGPTVSLRGVDNQSYYALSGPPGEPYRFYRNYTGCGNSINPANPQVLRLIADSLRYWVEVMHVDGFRFDLATVLGRGGGEFSAVSSFFDVVSQDPVLSRVKLIAEPWDVETYQVGEFPVDWCEWNGKFRDTCRRYVRGSWGQIGDLGRRLCGSDDLYGDEGRTAYSSINFVTCHDGFTLLDLVSYDGKHNEANLEANRDGTDDNNSWNCGVEGETDDPAIVGLRQQLAKNHLVTLFTSLGTPMMLGGDEFLRTQRGNNNAYCQDNEISWFDWDLARSNAGFLAFVKQVIQLTKSYKALQVTKFLKSRLMENLDLFDIRWFGRDLDQPRWDDPSERTLVMQIHGREKQLVEYYFLLLFNSDDEPHRIRLPELGEPFAWRLKIDTSRPSGLDFMEIGSEEYVRPTGVYAANPRSIVLLMARSMLSLQGT